MEKALGAVAKGFSQLDRPDPRDRYVGNQSIGRHPLLADFLKALRDEDSPQDRAHPVNTTILRGLQTALNQREPKYGYQHATLRDLAIVAFYWLLRPGEYLYSPDADTKRSTPFLLRDIHFTIDGKVHPATTAPLNDVNDVNRISFATLTFTDQKNAVKGEQIGHRNTDDPLLCPCKALGRIVFYLRQYNAPADTPLYRHFNPANSRWYNLKPAMMTLGLRFAAKAVQHLTGIDPVLISARSLRPGGATALFCANVDSDAVKLIGRWRSDAMLRYLRVQAHVISHDYANRMLQAGDFTFAPGQDSTNFPVPEQAPAAVLPYLQDIADEPSDAESVASATSN